MKKIAITLLLTCATALFSGWAVAQPRDGGFAESRLEDQAAECRSDPSCMRAVRISEARQEQTQREYEAKPWYEKVAGWILVLAIAAGIIWAYVLLFSLGSK